MAPGRIDFYRIVQSAFAKLNIYFISISLNITSYNTLDLFILLPQFGHEFYCSLSIAVAFPYRQQFEFPLLKFQPLWPILRFFYVLLDLKTKRKYFSTNRNELFRQFFRKWPKCSYHRFDCSNFALTTYV